MNISGIRTCAGFYDYNTLRNNEIRGQQIQEARAERDASPEQMEATSIEKVPDAVPDNGASEYAKQYQPEAVYDLKGAESDLANLDVEKAISAMKRDQVLQQYQFFVGEKKAGEELAGNRENENFSL